MVNIFFFHHHINIYFGSTIIQYSCEEYEQFKGSSYKLVGLKLCICLIERKYPGVIKMADYGGENHVVVEIEQGNSRVQGIAMVGGLSPLSQTLWKEKTDTKGIDVSARITWQDFRVQ